MKQGRLCLYACSCSRWKSSVSLMRAEIGEDGAAKRLWENNGRSSTVDGTITGGYSLEDGGVTVEALSGEYVCGWRKGCGRTGRSAAVRPLNCPAVGKPLSLNRRRRD
ncbi:MAG: hypothetical protein ACLUI3_16665 [Christensenellales bacterium]